MLALCSGCIDIYNTAMCFLLEGDIMGIIYKESIRNKKVSIIKILFFIVLFTLVAHLGANSADYSIKYEIRLELILLTDAVFFAIMIRMLYNMLYVNRIFYTYKLIDKELIFEKNIGSTRKVILSIDVTDIESFLPLKEDKGSKDIERTYKFLCLSSKKNDYSCVVNHKGKKMKLYFEPSSQLVGKLKYIMNQEP